MISSKEIQTVKTNFVLISKRFPENLFSKNGFLAVCQNIDPSCDLDSINKRALFGGLIGPGKSSLDNYLRFSKVLRVHAAFHDAYGFMRREYNIGAGYSYILPNLPNHFLVGHVTGIAFWLWSSIVSLQEEFNSLPF